MDFRIYEKNALLTMNTKLNEKDQTMNALLGLAGEIGEVIDYVKKVKYQGHEYKKEKMIDEMGDILWYLNLLSVMIGSSLEEVATYNIKKLRKRYQGQFSEEKSRNREE